MVRWAQAEVKHRAALADAYAGHLTALEMALMGAAERREPAPTSDRDRRETPKD